MTQDLAGAAPARGRSPAVDRVGSSKITFSTPRALSGRRSASHAEASGERARSTLASVCCARLSNRQVKPESSSTTTLQWSASARRAPQVVLRFEKPPASLSHRLVQLRLDRWQRKASRRIRDHRPWMDAKKTSAAPHAAKPPRWRQLAEGFSLHARWSAGADGGMGATSSVAGMSL
mmetsp:Transcript_41960/g.138182  ORF Transcript_41960/g.138182 Transcript_41960/m.138182 type:complete len:177 (-) Transcript_41960:247-777(-)